MAEGSGNNEAWVTLATNDSYSLGALVLAQSLRRVGTTRALAVMVTPDVSPSMRNTLSQLFDAIIDVNVLDSQDAVNLALLSRPDLGVTFTKLHCWRLTQYSKCVFLDADTLVIQNSDELFNREEFSAAPDSGWPDCFNSGVFVYRPNMNTYARLLTFAVEIGSFDGGDQGLLNLFFKDWATSDISRHLPFVYNMIASAIYSYLPAYKQFAQNVKIAHFIGAVKPWLQHFDGTTCQVRPQPGQEHQVDLLQAWWDVFRSEVHHRLTPEMDYGNKASVPELEQQGYFDAPATAEAIAASSRDTSFETHPQPSPQHPSPESHSHPQSHSHSKPDPDPEPPKPPPLGVAIYRFTPEYILNPKPPPPPPLPATLPHNTRSQSQSSSSNSEGDDPADGAKGIAGIYSKLTFDAASAAARSPEQIAYEEEMRRVAWEQGSMDYMGKDSFDNILKKIQASMAQTTTRGKSPSPPKTAAPPPTPVAAPAPEPTPPTPAAAPAPETIPAPVPPQPQVPPTPVLEADPGAGPPPAPKVEVPISEEPTIPPPAPQAMPSMPAPAAESPVLDPAAPVPASGAPKSDAPPVTAAPPPTPAAAGKTAEEVEEALRLAERQAIEKKLAEQMRTAEQKLQEERAKAGAAPPQPQPSEAAATPAAAPPPQPEAPQPAPTAPAPTPAAEPAQPAPEAAPEGAAAKPGGPPPQQPKAPPRKGSKDKASGWILAGAVGVGVGLSAIALYALFNGSGGSSSLSHR